MKQKRFMRPAQFVKEYGFISIQGLRYLIAHDKEFVEKCVRRWGYRVLLDIDAVMEFIDALPKTFVTAKEKKNKKNSV